MLSIITLLLIDVLWILGDTKKDSSGVTHVKDSCANRNRKQTYKEKRKNVNDKDKMYYVCQNFSVHELIGKLVSLTLKNSYKREGIGFWFWKVECDCMRDHFQRRR